MIKQRVPITEVIADNAELPGGSRDDEDPLIVPVVAGMAVKSALDAYAEEKTDILPDEVQELHPTEYIRSILTDAGYKPHEVADNDVDVLAWYWLGSLEGGARRLPSYTPPPGINWRPGPNRMSEAALDEMIETFTHLPVAPAFREVVNVLHRLLLPRQGGMTEMSAQMAIVRWVSGGWAPGANSVYAIGREFDMRYEDRVRTMKLEALYEKYLESKE